MNSFENQIKSAQNVAKLFLLLSDEQKLAFELQLMDLKVKNEIQLANPTLTQSEVNNIYSNELSSILAFLRSLTEEQQHELLNSLKSLKESTRSNSNIDITINLNI